MWQNWQHIISEEAKKYGYGEDRILRDSKIKAAAEAWFNSLPKECLAELKQRVGKAIAAANTKNRPLSPVDVMNILLILKAHNVKPLLGSMQASMTAVETMMQPDRMESVEVTESIEEDGEELTEAPYKTSTGTPKFVGKYQFTPFVEGSISGWFLRVQGFAKEVGFIEKPASKNTKTSVAPYKVYFHTEVSGHPELKANALLGNETRVIQSNKISFTAGQLLKAVAMWMDAYGYRMVGEGLESVEVDGDTINEGFRPEDYGYRVDQDSLRKDGKTIVIYKLSYSGGSIRFMDGRMGTVISRFATVREALAETKRLAKKDYPDAQIESIEAQGDTIAEAKKKLTPEQKAALKAYKLSCDMRDRDDITPDAYLHYEKRAKADAEACKKLGLGKEDGVYESVEVAEATSKWLVNSKIPLIGTFTHATTGVRFDYRVSDDEYGKKHGLPHEVHVGVNSASGETRPALVKGSVCIIGVDEGADGKPVLEKWSIKQHILYLPADPGRSVKWSKLYRPMTMRGEEFESEDTSLIEATYNKAKAKNRKKIVDGIKKVLNGEMSKQDFMRLIGAESEDHPMVVKTMAKMKDLVAKRTTIQLKAK